jgi:DNA-binding MarR family transcriptional regulator
MSERFSPLTRFFHPEELRWLSEDEVGDLLQRELDKTNISITPEGKKKIFELSKGHPYIVTSVGYVIFENLPEDIKEITAEHLDILSRQISNYLEVEFFGRIYNGASPLEKLILDTIAESGGRITFSKLVAKTKKSKGSLSATLGILVRQGAIEKKERGLYILFHHLFVNYVLWRIENE